MMVESLPRTLIEAGRQTKLNSTDIIVLVPMQAVAAANAAVRLAARKLATEGRNLSATVTGTDQLAEQDLALVIDVRRAFDSPTIATLSDDPFAGIDENTEYDATRPAVG